MARYNSFYPTYVPVSVRKERNRKALDKLKKKSDIQPVHVSGRKIAKTWWGAHWCENLERYADYSNRIGRGRSYVRHGAVLDLQITEGEIKAVVKGSRATPYNITISIEKLAAGKRDKLCKASARSVDSLSDLLGGKFTQELKSLFFDRKNGIYPAPGEISFNCSCPDWASMCKHVAAALYGVGRRLDDSPAMLFQLRSVSLQDLVEKTLDDSTDELMKKADAASGDDVMKDADIEAVFGIEMDQTPGGEIDIPSVADFSRVHSDDDSGKQEAEDNAASPPAKCSGSIQKKLSYSAPVLARFMETASSIGGTFRKPDLRPLLPDWSPPKIANTLYRAHREGYLERVSTGVYKVSEK